MTLIGKIRAMFDSRDSLKKKVFVGSLWLYSLEISSKGLLIVQTVILARLLAPEQFGVIGVYFIVSAALESFTRTGFNKALIQKKDVCESFLNTTWTISIVRGGLLFTLLYACSPVLTAYLGVPEALSVVRFLGLSLLIKGFNNVGTIFFSKDLQFHKQFVWKIGGFIANFAVSVPLAFLLRNEWAIVLGLLASDLTVLLLSYVCHPYRPRLRLNYIAFKELFVYGKWILLSAIVVFFSKQGDKIFVTKLLGGASLGIYMIAWRFANIPELLTKPLPNSLFPAFVRFQDNPSAMKAKYLEAVRVITVFTIPLAFGIIILAKPFIQIFLGEQWIAAVLPLQILTAAASINMFVVMSRSLFNAMGKTVFNFKVNVVRLVVLGVVVYPLTTRYGVVGASLSYLLISLAALVVWKYEIYKLIKLAAGELRCLILPIATSSIVAFVLTLLMAHIPINTILLFLGVLCVGGLLYIGLTGLLARMTRQPIIDDVKQIVHLMKPSGRICKKVDEAG